MIDQSEYQALKNRILDEKKDQDETTSKLASLINKRDSRQTYLLAAREAHEILKAVARETQSEIEEYLSGVVTLTLESVEVDDPDIPPPPQFVVRMVERRDTTECDLLFKEGDREQRPLECSGFGYVDIADYALRICYIMLEIEYGSKDIRRTVISDEPFRNVDPKLQFKVSEMLTMISEDLHFQQIIVSHAKGVNSGANKIFSVARRGLISEVKSELLAR